MKVFARVKDRELLQKAVDALSADIGSFARHDFRCWALPSTAQRLCGRRPAGWRGGYRQGPRFLRGLCRRRPSACAVDGRPGGVVAIGRDHDFCEGSAVDGPAPVRSTAGRVAWWLSGGTTISARALPSTAQRLCGRRPDGWRGGCREGPRFLRGPCRRRPRACAVDGRKCGAAIVAAQGLPG